MKNYAKYLFILAVITLFCNAYAVDMSNPEADLQGYCNESATLSGIEDTEDRNEYVEACMQSFGGTMEQQTATE